MGAYLISLPPDTQAAVVALVVAGIGILIRLVANYVPWLGEFLDKYKEEWGTAVGIYLVNLLQTYLPGGEWAGVSILLVQVVVAVLTVVIGKALFRKAGARGFK